MVIAIWLAASGIEVLGHIGMDQDPERPYSGHIIDIAASVSVERTGRVSIAESDITVLETRTKNGKLRPFYSAGAFARRICSAVVEALAVIGSGAKPSRFARLARRFPLG
ncbi:hypothetical protein WT24_17285 [Burkholderia sp. MSMB1078WGS]|uniref:hypothetical protein n=1 Tax=Burkholderia sp. MSMB1078WGS TaxID=1637900 RepID=UPI00075DE9C6|nr:hypothetical protein [Burkholderia sp. MSMB1078WGS]KVT08112.1 hypothetical protein WT24_17285 [Burkholderia sp. MSMB1078WGS]